MKQRETALQTKHDDELKTLQALWEKFRIQEAAGESGENAVAIQENDADEEKKHDGPSKAQRKKVEYCIICNFPVLHNSRVTRI